MSRSALTAAGCPTDMLAAKKQKGYRKIACNPFVFIFGAMLRLLLGDRKIDGFCYIDGLGASMARFDTTERLGVNAVEGIVLRELGWIFREQPVIDMGIDAHIELIDDRGPTGKLLAVQIKTGPSHFVEKDDAYVFRGSMTHLDYWKNHSLPVILVAHLPASGKTLWVYIDSNKVHLAGKSWTIQIPKTNLLGRSTKHTLSAFFEGSPSQQRMRRLVIDEPLMKHIRRGGKVSVEIEDWITKGLKRGDVEVFIHDKTGGEALARKWSFLRTGRDMKLFAETVFPWAIASVDDEFYEEYEDFLGGYGDNGNWQSMLGEARYRERTSRADHVYPYANDGGEVARYRLRLKLGKLGRAYLVVSGYASGPSNK